MGENEAALRLDQPTLQKRDRFWKRIIERIEQREVIPVVGQELLWFDDAKRLAGGYSLYDLLADEFASALNLQRGIDPNRSALSAILASHPAFKDKTHEAYEDLKEVYDRSALGIPDPIRRLAEIRPLRLFVTTTFDDCLERALNMVRYGGRAKTLVLTYSYGKRPDSKTIDAALGSGETVVFKLFGSINRPLNGYAVTEADYVEFMYRLQSKEYRPERLFEEMKDKHILLLGNSFPDWLARFFLRLTRYYPLDSSQGTTMQYLADGIFSRDPVLQFFLDRFTKMAEVAPEVSGIEFVQQLYERWISIHGETISDARAEPVPVDEMPASAVFISYVAKDVDGSDSLDLTAAINLKEALENQGIDAWLDRRGGLEFGDPWEKKIKRNISLCSLFLPILSATAGRRTEGFFRKEWAWARERNLQLTGSDHPFIVPIIIDDTEIRNSRNFPEEFWNLHVARLDGGQTSAEFLRRIKDLVRIVRKKEAQVV
jgi:hypothetical protein